MQQLIHIRNFFLKKKKRKRERKNNLLRSEMKKGEIDKPQRWWSQNQHHHLGFVEVGLGVPGNPTLGVQHRP